MKICCPDCGFTREMPDERVPKGEVVATCPRCSCRFRFSRADALAHTAAQPTGTSGSGDDSLPPGAIIPPAADPFSEGHTGIPEPAPRKNATSGDGASPSAKEDAAKAGEEGEKDAGPREDEQAGEPEPERPELWGNIPDEGDPDGRIANPWETAPGSQGYLSAFYQTCIRVMFAPSRFFAGLRPAPFMRSLTFYLVICVLQIAMERVWSMLVLSYITPMAASDPQMEQLVKLLTPQGSFLLSLLLRCAVLTMQIFIFAGILTLVLRFLAPGHADFSVLFQVLAYAEAPGILCLVPVAGSIAGLIWGLVCMAIGCRSALKLTWPQTIGGFAPIVLLLVPSFLQVFSLLHI